MSDRSPAFVTWLPIAAMMGSILSLCVGSSFAKTLFPMAGAEGTTAIRLGFAAVLLLARWRPWRWPLSRRDAGTIEFTGPLVLAILSSRRALDFVWIGFAVLGLALLMPLDGRASGLDPLGVMYAIGAGVCWALYIISGKRAGNLHGGQATSLGMLVATLVVLPVGFSQAGAALLNPSWLGGGSDPLQAGRKGG